MEQETFTAFIYSLYDHLDGLCYIGSTTKSIEWRLKKHESKYKCYVNGTYSKFLSPFKILRNGDYDISLLKQVEVSSIQKLREIEGDFIKKTDCVNKLVAGQTRKQYRDRNKENIKNKGKIYYEQNSESIKNKQKLYYEQNSEVIKEKQRQYEQRNKERTKQRKTTKITCVCGSTICKGDKAKHERTKKHINFIEQN